MRLKYPFEEMKLNNQTVAVPVGVDVEGFNSVLKMNDTAFDIYNLLKVETTEEKIIESLSKEYNVDQDTLIADVKKSIQELREKGFITE